MSSGTDRHEHENGDAGRKPAAGARGPKKKKGPPEEERLLTAESGPAATPRPTEEGDASGDGEGRRETPPPARIPETTLLGSGSGDAAPEPTLPRYREAGERRRAAVLAVEPTGFALVWRPLRWVLLVILALYVFAQLLATMNQSLEEATVGGGSSAGASGSSTVKAKAGQQVRVTIEGLNLRTQPSIGGGVIIRKLPKGDTVELLGRKAGWFQVRASDGTKGWVVDRQGYTQLQGG